MISNLNHLDSFFDTENAIYFHQDEYSEKQLSQLYENEQHDYITYIQAYFNHYFSQNIPKEATELLNYCFIDMIGRYHLVKEILSSTNVDYLFICTSEIYLIDLAHQMNTKTIFLEHSPNLFPFVVFNDSIKNHIPFKTTFPDIILSENQLTTRHWQHQCTQLNQLQTQVIETGLPLDNMIKPSRISKSKKHPFTISIFNTWLDKSSPENLIENELNLIMLFDELFSSLKDLLTITPFRILLKNHPKLDENAYQTHGFYNQLAKKYGIADFEICQDLDATINQTDLAITLGKSSLLTDLLYSKIPSIIYNLFSNPATSYSDDINNIFPMVSSTHDLHLLIKKYLVSNEYDTHQNKLSDIHNKFQLNQKTIEEKCHQIIEFLS